jgi:hypothetical protein
LTDLEKARALLEDKSFGSFILYNSGTIHAGSGESAAPMLEFIESGLDMKGFSAAVAAVGKASALLFAYSGIEAVYADVISGEAVGILKRFKIRTVYGELSVQAGGCPLESAVESINEPEAAYEALKVKYNVLLRNTRR